VQGAEPTPRVAPAVSAPGDARKTWYFTFGAAHFHANHYVVIEDATSEEARDRMMELFGRHWAFQYDEDGWMVPLDRRDPQSPRVTQAEKYGLERLA